MGLMDGVRAAFQYRPTLTADEQARFETLKAAVRTGVKAWHAAAVALKAIRDEQLYRTTAANFESFAEIEFGLTGRRLSQLVDAAALYDRIAAELPAAVVAGPPAERALRELSQLPTAERVAAYGEAVAIATESAGQPTAPSTKTVADTVARRRAASGRKPKARPKAVRFRVPGAVVTIAWNAKGSGDAAAALQAALAQLASKPSRAA